MNEELYHELEYQSYRRRRNRTRMERMRWQTRRRKLAAALLALALTVAVALLTSAPPAEIAEETIAEEATAVLVTTIPAPAAVPAAEDDSPLYHQEAIRFYPVPLDHDLQAYIIRTCYEYGMDPALIMALIQKESAFDASAIGGGGDSAGLMQVQEKWHRERMERLGATDLLDPYQNTLVGIDYLAELLDKYSVADALTAYNSGSPGESAYAEAVLENYANFEEETL